jgi:hypothetical protein
MTLDEWALWPRSYTAIIMEIQHESRDIKIKLLRVDIPV